MTIVASNEGLTIIAGINEDKTRLLARPNGERKRERGREREKERERDREESNATRQERERFLRRLGRPEGHVHGFFDQSSDARAEILLICYSAKSWQAKVDPRARFLNGHR